jgi:hypothetical protein
MTIKTIDVNALEWFDKVNGNSYFAGFVTINYKMKDEKNFVMPFEYGYGDFYQQRALDILIKNGFVKGDYHSLSRFCRDNDIILRSDKVRTPRKKDLKYMQNYAESLSN